MELVSVVLPVYDDLEHVQRAIESVLRQDHDPIEIVVVHSGDRASFPPALREHPAVTYLHQEPRGVAAARNRGLDAAEGEVVGFCDADDYWHPDKLARQLPVLRSGADVVYSDEYLLRDGSTHLIESLSIRDPETHYVDFFRNGGGVGSRTVLARASCFERERFDERLAVREDPHLWTRLFASFTPGRVPEPLSYKQVTAGSLSSDVDRAYRMERLEIEDLCERYPALRPYREERERQLRYRYAKRLLTEADRPGDARRVLGDALRGETANPRIWAVLLLSHLPAGNQWAARRVQEALWTLRSWRRRLGAGRSVSRPSTVDGDPVASLLSDGGRDDESADDGRAGDDS